MSVLFWCSTVFKWSKWIFITYVIELYNSMFAAESYPLYRSTTSSTWKLFDRKHFQSAVCPFLPFFWLISKSKQSNHACQAENETPKWETQQKYFNKRKRSKITGLFSVWVLFIFLHHIFECFYTSYMYDVYLSTNAMSLPVFTV